MTRRRFSVIEATRSLVAARRDLEAVGDDRGPEFERRVKDYSDAVVTLIRAAERELGAAADGEGSGQA